jgi:opacity protein-like surface antigen
MKKILNIIIFIFSINLIFSQDISDNAIGIRFGNQKSFEISFQRIIGETNRLELDLGYSSLNNYDVYRLMGLNQWVVAFDDSLNWFAGIGGGVGTWQYKKEQDPLELDRIKNGNFFALAASIGLEYNFDFPVIISLDMRPKYYFGSGFGSELNGLEFGIGIRYQFE